MKYEDEQYYHVFNRGAHRGPIFFSPHNYRYLISLFKRHQARYGISLLAYCLMPNHYHLVLGQNPGGSISTFLQTVFNAYTQAVNLRGGFTGTLFEGRARGRLIHSDDYVMRVIRYVHLNPVRAGLVQQPQEWEYSDYREWIDLGAVEWAKAGLRGQYFASGEAYRLFVSQYDEAQEDSALKIYFSGDTSSSLETVQRPRSNPADPSQGLRVIDLNSDLGERPEALADGSEEALIKLISSANIACGEHAGDEETMERVVRLAMKYGVRIGAHPSYPDREHFGRRELEMTFDEIRNSVAGQIQALANVTRELGATLSHVKPHGALYNVAAKDARVAHAIAAGVENVDDSLMLIGLAESETLAVWRELGFRVVAEAFADRLYEPDGSLRSRTFPDALITDPERAAQQALAIARDGCVIAPDGSRVRIDAQTICMHSDTPNAVEIARAVRKALVDAGFRIQAW